MTRFSSHRWNRVLTPELPTPPDHHPEGRRGAGNQQGTGDRTVTGLASPAGRGRCAVHIRRGAGIVHLTGKAVCPNVLDVSQSGGSWSTSWPTCRRGCSESPCVDVKNLLQAENQQSSVPRYEPGSSGGARFHAEQVLVGAAGSSQASGATASPVGPLWHASGGDQIEKGAGSWSTGTTSHVESAPSRRATWRGIALALFSLVSRRYPVLAGFIAPWLWPMHLAVVGGQGDQIRFLGGASLAVSDGERHRVQLADFGRGSGGPSRAVCLDPAGQCCDRDRLASPVELPHLPVCRLFW